MSCPESLTSQKQAEFERHVESRKIGALSETYGRYSVHSIRTLLNNPRDLIQADFAAVIGLKRTSRNKSEIVNSENDRIKYRLIRVVERAINKNVFGQETGRQLLTRFRDVRELRRKQLFRLPTPELTLLRRCMHHRQTMRFEDPHRAIHAVYHQLSRICPPDNLARPLPDPSFFTAQAPSLRNNVSRLRHE
jgi:hypothetical protein